VSGQSELACVSACCEGNVDVYSDVSGTHRVFCFISADIRSC